MKTVQWLDKKENRMGVFSKSYPVFVEQSTKQINFNEN